MTSDILKGQLLELGVTEWLSNYAERRARRADTVVKEYIPGVYFDGW
jgi:hypothetical protein